MTDLELLHPVPDYGPVKSSAGWDMPLWLYETQPTTVSVKAFLPSTRFRLSEEMQLVTFIYQVLQSATSVPNVTAAALAGPRADSFHDFYRFAETIHSIQQLRERPTDNRNTEECLRVATRDALLFVTKLPQSVPAPRVSASEEGEVVLEWFANGREAVVSFEGDRTFGYALLEGGDFKPGEHEGVLDDPELPPDLIEYLAA